ncbi:unnamed protein product [Ectocarpus sp. CCAP 1310/34]|nr:unnamed protein product [Ectocarpus sp. CCAP 1310/34]
MCRLQGGYPRVVRMLLQAGANVAVEAATMYTALHGSTVTGCQVAQMLIDAGANNVDAGNEDGVTPLMFACCDGRKIGRRESVHRGGSKG